MERLTGKFGDKVVLPIIPMEIKNQSDLERFHKVRKKYEENTIKLSEYEDIGLSPEEVKQFKDAEEQGLLLRLPCKVGDIVYLIKSDGKIVPRTADMQFLGVLWDDYGKEWFLTQAEAEQKLKEMESD